jgi:hypothetical protein
VVALKRELKVFIGWDSRFPEVSDVCAYSLQRRSSIPVHISYLKLGELLEAGLHKRGHDPLASTEFTYSRFLTPYLSGYKGTALYCDNDFLWLDDVSKLLGSCAGGYPLYCVQQHHNPPEGLKMDNRPQTKYPRKNWSSLMLFNCAHPGNRSLNTEKINSETGSYLHQLKWLADEEIGILDHRWNWLEGWSPLVDIERLGAVHFTRGGPWFSQFRNCDYAELWLKEREDFRRESAKNSCSLIKTV